MRPRVCHGGNPNKKLDIHKHNDMKSRLIYSMILYIIHFYIYSLGSCGYFLHVFVSKKNTGLRTKLLVDL